MNKKIQIKNKVSSDGSERDLSMKPAEFEISHLTESYDKKTAENFRNF